jgi:hypothetical protein
MSFASAFWKIERVAFTPYGLQVWVSKNVAPVIVSVR